MKKDVEDPLIWQVPNSLTDEFCDELVRKFEEDPDKTKYRGIVGSGKPNPNLKETMDLVVDPELDFWKETDEFICDKIGKDMNAYVKYIYEVVPNIDFHNGIEKVNDSGYHIQKYEPNIGFYNWHNDYAFEEDKGSRILTFIWYLNTVERGGETEFTNGMKIKAEKGKLIMFPSTWTYTHRGCMPYSGEKYILTGWLYNGWNSNVRTLD